MVWRWASGSSAITVGRHCAQQVRLPIWTADPLSTSAPMIRLLHLKQ
jgi:hypothetical protein